MHCNLKPPDVASVVLGSKLTTKILIHQPTNSTGLQPARINYSAPTHQLSTQSKNPLRSYCDLNVKFWRRPPSWIWPEVDCHNSVAFKNAHCTSLPNANKIGQCVFVLVIDSAHSPRPFFIGRNSHPVFSEIWVTTWHQILRRHRPVIGTPWICFRFRMHWSLSELCYSKRTGPKIQGKLGIFHTLVKLGERLTKCLNPYFKFSLGPNLIQFWHVAAVRAGTCSTVFRSLFSGGEIVAHFSQKCKDRSTPNFGRTHNRHRRCTVVIIQHAKCYFTRNFYSFTTISQTRSLLRGALTACIFLRRFPEHRMHRSRRLSSNSGVGLMRRSGLSNKLCAAELRP